LPKEGWKFKLDPSRTGHLDGWFGGDFDDAGWDDIAIEQAWQEADYDYIGVTWYRRTITLPAKPDLFAAEMVFEGVDESAWLWVNGEYAGQHDIGMAGWDKLFRIDVTPLLNWGSENQITVRAMNTRYAGGIWKPVYIEALNK
jgi:beta-galactosidase/beta-glucuronidase